MFDSSTSSNSTGKFQTVKSSLGKLASLYIEGAKLTAVEKLTLFLSAAVVFFCGFILLTFVVAFGAVAILDLLEKALPPIASAGILSGIFLVLALLLILLRKPLVINPMTRFVSKLIMDIGKNKLA